jgi:ribosomal protein S18 acetylase RimI-like enzyme
MTTLKTDTCFAVQLNVVLRLARREDLPLLEWFGQYTHFRRLYLHTFDDQQQGRRLMLVADAGGYPVGQIFVHLADAGLSLHARYWHGYLYSLRVMEPLRGNGIGTRLIQEAETRLFALDYRWVTIAVAKTNAAARRLYERLGYGVYGDDPGHWHYTDHLGQIQEVVEPSWMLKKRLQK